ncbi:DNA methyltransferase, partial [Candidatus Saccharibacteria bacterium]|nr:DNA methyltransferase [Calditrichia bacterium]NIV71682.1 DNA methyltransferase [Calditrichia bacterium]NIW00052.1 DNA methyltransferase [Candidatus Saccharibacteria bacterium]NIW80006.1 DNA methyltransferase [Calditrichia bacterium]
MPWQHSGIKAGRTWVIAPEKNLLEKRWNKLLTADKNERDNLFKNSPTGRKVHQSATQLPPSQDRLPPIINLPKDYAVPKIIRYAFRSLDRQFIFADARQLDRPGPDLWRAHSEKQVYVTSLLNHPLGLGPSLTVSANIPDLHHFRGSYGAKEVFPLYRTSDNNNSNILPGLLDLFGKEYKFRVTPSDFLAYVYCVLAHPAFT